MQTIETFGRLHVLVSNAGVQNVAPLVEFCQALSARDSLHVTVSANSMPPKSVSLKETAQ
ncbi:hypothetical protein [Mesorhizobium kowhaii]|uniref:Uncharacterized protein n=1 Tax=Mesorhizobium kowhaii TaxID=1300272 RepID=A0A2W7C5P5_9HYPH|nr:hypothetical protein [Mesorhizobium kowhaii]PZV37148.1 hypothetical protein B5V02_18295 [Mesorhizobium kowhaii]